MLKSKFISIEGNIGSGKSTLLQLLQSHLNNDHYLFLNEPLSDWQSIRDPFMKTQSQINLLQMFYEDPKRWGYTFQSYAFFSRIRNYHQAIEQSVVSRSNTDQRSNQLNYVISERSILSDKYVFAENSYSQNIMTESEKIIYDNWFHFLYQIIGHPYSAHIYLQCDPEVSFERIRKRQRNEENTIQLEYIQSIHQRHQEWLVDGLHCDKNPNHESSIHKPKVVVIDVNHDFQKDKEYQQEIIGKITQFIQTL